MAASLNRQFVHVGVGGELPRSATFHRYVHVAILVGLHCALVGVVAVRGQYQVAGAALCGPTLVVVHFHQHLAGHVDVDVGQGERASYVGWHFAERSHLRCRGDGAVADVDFAVVALRVARAALQYHHGSAVVAACELAAVYLDGVVALYHAHLTLLRRASGVACADVASGVEYGTVLAEAAVVAPVYLDDASAPVGGHHRGMVALGENVEVRGVDNATACGMNAP